MTTVMLMVGSPDHDPAAQVGGPVYWLSAACLVVWVGMVLYAIFIGGK